jgi:hypothetical protein
VLFARWAIELCSYLTARTCVLEICDLSWNTIGERGAFEFAAALRVNKSLKKLNLSANGLNDSGGQRLADSLPDNSSIEELSLSQNGLKDGTCFVLSQVCCGMAFVRSISLISYWCPVCLIGPTRPSDFAKVGVKFEPIGGGRCTIIVSNDFAWFKMFCGHARLFLS